MVFLDISRNTFFIYEKWMRMCGIWPLDGFKNKWVIFYLLLLLIEIALILSQFVGPFSKCIADEVMTEAVLKTCLIFGATSRLTMRLLGNRTIPLIESTIDDWSSITEPTEWIIMKRHDQFGTLIFLVLILLWLPYDYVREGIALAFPNAITALDYQLGCTGNNARTSEIIAGVLHIAMKSFEFMSYLSGILLFWSLAMHLSGQYRILKQQFKEFLLIANKKERLREFRRLVKRHNHLLDLNRKLEETFNVFLGLDFLGSQVLTCMQASLLAYAIKNTDPMEVADILLHIMANIVPLFLYCYVSDYLTMCSQDVGEVLAQCKWYDLSKESITDFSIVIARSRMPISITAAKLFEFNLNNFKTCGIWPLDAFKSTSLIVNSVIVLLEIVLIISSLISLFVKCFVNVTKHESVPSAVFIFLSTLRLTMLLYGSRSIPVIESTIDDWSSITDPTKWKIMKRHDKFGTYPLLILIIWFFTCPFIRDVLVSVFSNKPTNLDNEPNCVGNKTLMWGNAFEFFIVAMTVFNTLSYFSSFLLFWSLAMHLCGQYQILKQQFEEFLLKADKKERRREFRCLVQRHNHLLDLSGKIEDAFNVFLAIVIFGGQILICFNAARLGHAIRNKDFVKMALAFVLISFYTAAIFVYYYISDYLTTCGEMISEVFIQCNWYDLSKESITNFSIVIARCQMPPRFTAAKLYILNIANFKQVVNAIYSYVSLIVAITAE